jgi:uncharacterized membrane protein
MFFLLTIIILYLENNYLIKNRPFGYNIESNILLGVKESSDPEFYKELHKLLLARDFKKLEECLRASYSNLAKNLLNLINYTMILLSIIFPEKIYILIIKVLMLLL